MSTPFPWQGKFWGLQPWSCACYTRVLECLCLGRDESEVSGGGGHQLDKGSDVSGESGSFLGVEDSIMYRGPQTQDFHRGFSSLCSMTLGKLQNPLYLVGF